MSTDTIISVEGVSKKFCRSLKYTMLHGLRDIARDVFGLSQYTNGLRHDEFWALNDVCLEIKHGEIVERRMRPPVTTASVNDALCV